MWVCQPHVSGLCLMGTCARRSVFGNMSTRTSHFHVDRELSVCSHSSADACGYPPMEGQLPSEAGSPQCGRQFSRVPGAPCSLQALGSTGEKERLVSWALQPSSPAGVPSWPPSPLSGSQGCRFKVQGASCLGCLRAQGAAKEHNQQVGTSSEPGPAKLGGPQGTPRTEHRR